MAFTTVPAVVTGQTYLASDYNTYVADNLNALNVGTTAGDMVYWGSATTPTRLALGVGGVLYGGASAPAWLAKPTNPGLLTNTSAGTPSYIQPVANYVYRVNAGRTAVEGFGLGENFVVARSADQTGIPSTETAISWDASGGDSGAGSLSSGSRLLIGTTGVYLAFGTVQFSTASAYRYYTIKMRLNGTATVNQTRAGYDSNYQGMLTTAPAVLNLTGGASYLELTIDNCAGTIYGAGLSYLSVLRVK